MTNFGNQITGGTFSGITTVGDHAQVTHSTTGEATEGEATAVALATELRALIEQHAASLDQPERARRDAAEVAEELGLPGEEQDRDRLSDTIKRLAARVASIGVLAEATRKLTDLIFT